MLPTSHPVAFAPEASLSLLRFRLRQGLKATPLCIAVIGWLCDAPTDPAVAEIKRSSGGNVLLRLSGEPTMEPLCSCAEFLQQISTVCQSVGMTQGQTRATVAWAEEKLG